MEIRVLGCHGGETPKHRTSSFLLGGTLGIDAGATTAVLTLREQKKLSAVLVSHAHLDHVRDLATLADNRCQMGDKPLLIAGTPWTLGALKKHFFNNVLWPDFSKIPLVNGGGMTIEYLSMKPEQTYEVAGYRARAVLVSHTIESAGFIVERAGAAIAYSGDTGPTERFWQLLAKTDALRAILMEVSFPNELRWLAEASGHHTPATLDAELTKLVRPKGAAEVPVLLYHIKPHFQREVERELVKLKRDECDVLSLDDELIL
jgi:cAMP phosphodiesterase